MGTDITEISVSLILYGGTHGEDLETVAFLDIEGDSYNVVPFAPEFQFEVKTKVSSEKALQEAIHFVGWHYTFERAKVSKVMDKQLNLIGYEVKPLYNRVRYGYSDILDVYYDIRGETVYMYVDFKQQIEKSFELERSVDEK